MAGVGVAPARAVLQPPGQHGLVAVIRAAHDKGAYRTKNFPDPVNIRARHGVLLLDSIPPETSVRGTSTGGVVATPLPRQGDYS